MKKYLNRIRQNKTIQESLSPDIHTQQTAIIKDNSDLSISQRKLLDIIQAPSSPDGKGVTQMMNPELKKLWDSLSDFEKLFFKLNKGLDDDDPYFTDLSKTHDAALIEYIREIHPEFEYPSKPTSTNAKIPPPPRKQEEKTPTKEDQEEQFLMKQYQDEQDEQLIRELLRKERAPMKQNQEELSLMEQYQDEQDEQLIRELFQKQQPRREQNKKERAEKAFMEKERKRTNLQKPSKKIFEIPKKPSKKISEVPKKPSKISGTLKKPSKTFGALKKSSKTSGTFEFLEVPEPATTAATAHIPAPRPIIYNPTLTVFTVPKVKNSEKTINLSVLFNLLMSKEKSVRAILQILNQLNGQEVTPKALSEITKLPPADLETVWVISKSVVPPMPSTTASQQETPPQPSHSINSIEIPEMQGEASYSKTQDESEAGYDIRITMPAIPELGEGAEIGFLQIVQSKKTDEVQRQRADAYNQETGAAPVTKESPDSAHGWTIDRQGSSAKNPYYGEGIPANYTPGSDKADAILHDHPVAFRPPWSPRFKTCAVIKKCPTYSHLVGTTLATLEWGFDLTPAPKPVLPSSKVFGEPNWIGFKEVHGTPTELILCARIWDNVHGKNPDYTKAPEVKSFPDNSQPIQPFPESMPEEKDNTEIKIEVPPTEKKEERDQEETKPEEEKQ